MLITILSIIITGSVAVILLSTHEEVVLKIIYNKYFLIGFIIFVLYLIVISMYDIIKEDCIYNKPWILVKKSYNNSIIKEIRTEMNCYVYFIEYNGELYRVENTNMKDKLKIGDTIQVSYKKYFVLFDKRKAKIFKFVSVLNKV